MKKQVGSRIGVLAAALWLVLCASSCFYDSRWGESKRLQQAAAKHATPGELRPTAGNGADPGASVRVMRLRVHATPRHAAEVVDWARQMAATLEDANRVLAPTLSVRLEVADSRSWPARADETDLTTLMDELRALDDGEGVDWVVGLTGSLPRAETSFHQLGLARRPGKHMILRAMNDVREYESIRKDLNEIAEEDRSKLYAARKRHKATTVFLHELAHTLGVIHQPDSTAIMSPRYGIKAERFSDEATEWMKATLRQRDQSPHPGEPSAQETILALLTRTPDRWIASERDEVLASLRAAPAAPQSQLAAPGPSAAPSPGPPGAGATVGSAAATSSSATVPLATADQALFAQAEVDEQAGKHFEAYQRAKPLFGKYPDVLAVQDMRCRLILRIDATDTTIQAECARFLKLSGAPAP